MFYQSFFTDTSIIMLLYRVTQKTRLLEKKWKKKNSKYAYKTKTNVLNNHSLKITFKKLRHPIDGFPYVFISSILVLYCSCKFDKTSQFKLSWFCHEFLFSKHRALFVHLCRLSLFCIFLILFIGFFLKSPIFRISA